MSVSSERKSILPSSRKIQQDLSPDSSGTMSDLKELVGGSTEQARSSLSSASYNFINSIIGSGVISMPFALAQAGFGVGIILLIIVAIVTDYSLILMVRGAYMAGTFSYQGLMEAAFGTPGLLILSLLQFVYPFIAMVSYNIAVGDTLTKVFIRVFGLGEKSLLAQRELVVGLCTFFVTLPLCLYRDLAKLSKVSLFSLFCVGFILSAIFFKFFMLYEIVPPSDDAWSFANTNLVPAIGLMTFAFMCHHNTFLVFQSIEEVDQERWNKVTHIALTVSFTISLLFGVLGYATFTGYSQGDILENYCWNDDLMNAARFFFGITILLTFPLECFVAREVLNNAVFPYFKATEEPTDKRHFLTTTALLLTTYVLSMRTDCLGVVVELNGVLAAVPLAYILPGLCYLRFEQAPLFSRTSLPALGLVIFGVGVAVTGIFFVLAEMGYASKCKSALQMPYCHANITKYRV